MVLDDELFLGNTLSVRSVPGQDKLYQNTTTESIFTFGDFRLTRNLTGNYLANNQNNLSFDRAQNLLSISSSGFNASQTIALTENDLNLDLSDPNSYSYFGSYYSKLAKTINKIIANFPYPILCYDGNTGQTNVIISANTQLSYTDIILISSAFTNQGNIIFTSGSSLNVLSSSTLTLFDNFEKFEIQLSSTTLNTTPSYPINIYNYSAYSNYYELKFRIGGIFSANTTDAIYIRPSKKRYFEYKRSLGNLEYQLLQVGKFSVPNPSNDQFFDKLIPWPRTIDGFSPDSYGTSFDNYLDEILKYASLTDQLKTDFMLRTLIPENYLELDSDNKIYTKLIQTYGEEFDQIKGYIDNLAFSHSINYTETETVSNKFLPRLTQLLGWKQPINFTDTDFFEFFGQEDDNNKTLEDYNYDLWRRILTNINWLYKRKGTRDAITFMFKVVGAPDCLVNFNEFVYQIKRNSEIITSTQQFGGVDSNDAYYVEFPTTKVNQYGYINFELSSYAFQEGGTGRGNGNDYINQWQPEFDPVRTIDNVKIHTGDPAYYGTQNIVNSKEVEIGMDPASAIECDVFDWYKIGFFYSGNTSANLPSDYKLTDVDLIAPPEISGFTIDQWLSFVYNNSLDVRSRKTEPSAHVNYFYPNLRKIYLTYYYWNVAGEISNMITYRRLENFLKLVESKFFVYIEQLLPATTVIDGVSSIYRNTVFNRQKFVYKKGINDGSEFQTRVPDQLYNLINAAVVTSKINRGIQPIIYPVTISSTVQNFINSTTYPVQIQGTVNLQIPLTINAISVTSNVLSSVTNTTQSVPLNATIINFPTSGTPVNTPPVVPTTYTGNTFSGGYLGPAPIIPPTL